MNSWYKKTSYEKTEELEDELAKVKAEIKRLMTEGDIEDMPSTFITSHESDMERCEASKTSIRNPLLPLPLKNTKCVNSMELSSDTIFRKKTESNNNCIKKDIFIYPITSKHSKTNAALNKLSVVNKRMATNINSCGSFISAINQKRKSSLKSSLAKCTNAIMSKVPRNTIMCKYTVRNAVPHKHTTSYLKVHQNVKQICHNIVEKTISKSNSNYGILHKEVTKKNSPRLATISTLSSKYPPEELVKSGIETVTDKANIGKTFSHLYPAKHNSDYVTNKLLMSESFGSLYHPLQNENENCDPTNIIKTKKIAPRKISSIHFSVRETLKEDSIPTSCSSDDHCLQTYTEECKSRKSSEMLETELNEVKHSQLLARKIISMKVQRNDHQSKQKLSVNKCCKTPRKFAIVLSPKVKHMNRVLSKTQILGKSLFKSASARQRASHYCSFEKNDNFNKVISKYPSPSLSTSAELKKLLASVSILRG